MYSLGAWRIVHLSSGGRLRSHRHDYEDTMQHMGLGSSHLPHCLVSKSSGKVRHLHYTINLCSTDCKVSICLTYGQCTVRIFSIPNRQTIDVRFSILGIVTVNIILKTYLASFVGRSSRDARQSTHDHRLLSISSICKETHDPCAFDNTKGRLTNTTYSRTVIGFIGCAHGRSSVGNLIRVFCMVPRHLTRTRPRCLGSCRSSTTPTNH